MHFLVFALLPVLAATQGTTVDYTSDSQFKVDILNSTNFYRSQHNASNVAWNDTLADYASNHAQGCQFAHTGGPYGENIAAGYANATASVEAWGNEGTHYDFAAGQFTDDTGHFTQLVWKATTTVGCGRANCSGENNTPGWYIICEYWPRGNIIGNFTQNVQQGSGSTSGTGSTASYMRLSVPGLIAVCLGMTYFL